MKGRVSPPVEVDPWKDARLARNPRVDLVVRQHQFTCNTCSYVTCLFICLTWDHHDHNYKDQDLDVLDVIGVITEDGRELHPPDLSQLKRMGSVVIIEQHREEFKKSIIVVFYFCPKRPSTLIRCLLVW